LEGHEPVGAKLLAAMKVRLSAKMGDSLRLMQGQQLDQVLQRIDAEVRHALEKDCYEFDTESLWRSFLPNSEFQFSPLGSQRLCYGAVYYAYEDFLLRTFKVVTGHVSYQIRADDYARDFATTFGTALSHSCWSDPAVLIALLTRHALVHNSGRVTDRLSRQKHSLRVEDGDFQIMPSDTKALFDLLKYRGLHDHKRGSRVAFRRGQAVMETTCERATSQTPFRSPVLSGRLYKNRDRE
jgi:hypothetical protein